MEQCKGLIAGIDIGYSKIQASVYSYNSRNVQTVKLTEDSKEKTSLAYIQRQHLQDQSCKCCR